MNGTSNLKKTMLGWPSYVRILVILSGILKKECLWWIRKQDYNYSLQFTIVILVRMVSLFPFLSLFSFHLKIKWIIISMNTGSCMIEDLFVLLIFPVIIFWVQLFKFLPRLSPRVANIFQEMKRHQRFFFFGVLSSFVRILNKITCAVVIHVFWWLHLSFLQSCAGIL